jgi:hypothetical protein
MSHQILTLTRYAESLGQLAQFGVPGAKEQKAAYDEILKLITAHPLESFEPPLFTGIHGLSYYPSLEQLLVSAKGAFAHRSSKEELADALEDFIHAITPEAADPLPEAGILIATAKRWLRALPQESDEPLLVLETRASLDLGYSEEDLSGGESARLTLALSMVNLGIPEACNISLDIEIAEGNPAVSIERAKEIEPTRWSIGISGNLRRNARADKVISILYKGQGKLNLRVDYFSVRRPDRPLPSDVLTVQLAPSSAPRNDIEPAQDYVNPYIPDLPLLTRPQWETLAV